jgi:hypothetical protein
MLSGRRLKKRHRIVRTRSNYKNQLIYRKRQQNSTFPSRVNPTMLMLLFNVSGNNDGRDRSSDAKPPLTRTCSILACLPGLPQIAYCQRHALAYHQFGYWSRKLNPRQASVAGLTRVQQRPATSQGLTVLLLDGIELRGINDANFSVVSRLLQQPA